jgi:hypothetical protein
MAAHAWRDKHYLSARVEKLCRDLALADTSDSPEEIRRVVYNIPDAALDQVLRLALATVDYRNPRLVSCFDAIYSDVKSRTIQESVNSAVVCGVFSK